ncbi:tRNA glutamyl-Q(34) synthetase GluQRS [Psychrobacter sp. I-STPA10]|uniref:tRNA glutamyl-Q(34) synthetase GluQRS n=1 Tax=Psychrobacter sp. I-STPA10 TaxID=2585769 RepID=UPI001E3440A6|nr:tRNA glutamyl-Q(34) synthetase GluQRS [Psychrobacter sp. I-STPA10]
MSEPTLTPIGRFAPSPTGELHLGSLTTAIASYCHIKSIGGQWLLRMEDTDNIRCEPQFAHQILIDLECLGLQWDGDILYQSERIDIYNEWMYEHLTPRLYGCNCSRKHLNQYQRSLSKQNLPNPPTYPRLCLHKQLSLRSNKVRVQLADYSLAFIDQLQGIQWTNPQQSLGDVVLRRANGIINYFLAVSIDDGLQGITHIMRGLDILPLTCAQICLMQYLNLPAIHKWYHLPLVKNSQGQKLSKQNLAAPIDTSTTTKCSQLIATALTMLHQPDVSLDTPENMLKQAVAQWDNCPLQHQQSLVQLP